VWNLLNPTEPLELIKPKLPLYNNIKTFDFSTLIIIPYSYRNWFNSIFSDDIIIYISTALDIDKSYFLKIHPETDISGVCGDISETTEKICYISILIDGYMYR
jgi:hypothetical protein